MSFRPPTEADVRELADALGLELNDDEVELHQALLTANLEMYEIIEDLNVENVGPPRPEDRDEGWRPLEIENPYNAWITRCDVTGASSGPLEG